MGKGRSKRLRSRLLSEPRKRRVVSEETKQKMRESYQKRTEPKKEKKTINKPKDLREELADYLGLSK